MLRFKPCGVPADKLETVTLTIDELEAIRLADLEGLYQEQAAATMNVSRQTFGNILSLAHAKVAEFLVHSKALSIEGGNVEVKNCRLICGSCGESWKIPCGSALPEACPKCNAGNVYCSKKSENATNHKKCWRKV